MTPDSAHAASSPTDLVARAVLERAEADISRLEKRIAVLSDSLADRVGLTDHALAQLRDANAVIATMRSDYGESTVAAQEGYAALKARTDAAAEQAAADLATARRELTAARAALSALQGGDSSPASDHG